MNVRLIDERVIADEACKIAICAIDPASGAQIEVRHLTEGKLTIIIHGGHVTIQPRVTIQPQDAAVWIEVES